MENQTGQEQLGQAEARQAVGALSQGPAKNPGILGELIIRLEKQNAEFNEHILNQRDVSIKLTGDNPVVETEGADTPTPQGDISAFEAAVNRNNELLSKLRGLTEHWQSL